MIQPKPSSLLSLVWGKQYHIYKLYSVIDCGEENSSTNRIDKLSSVIEGHPKLAMPTGNSGISYKGHIVLTSSDGKTHTKVMSIKVQHIKYLFATPREKLPAGNHPRRKLDIKSLLEK